MYVYLRNLKKYNDAFHTMIESAGISAAKIFNLLINGDDKRFKYVTGAIAFTD